MRRSFDSRLQEIEQRLSHALAAAAQTLRTLDATVPAPRPDAVGRLVEAGVEMRRMSREADLELVTLLACHAPVACDLRLVLTAIKVAQHVGLIANQLKLIGEQLAEIDPEVPDACGTGQTVVAMVRVACGQVARAADAFAGHDPELVHQLESDDDVLDRLNRDVCRAAMGGTGGAPARELALRHVLIARSLERIGDNAVTIAAQTALLVEADVHQLAHLGAAAPAVA